MNTWEAKHQMKLAEWQARVAECRSSGTGLLQLAAQAGRKICRGFTREAQTKAAGAGKACSGRSAGMGK